MLRKTAGKIWRFARRITGNGPPPPVVYDPAWEPRGEPTPTFPQLRSQACTQAQLQTPEFKALATILDGRPLMHRKQWEWCFIVQALDEAGMLREGARGVGFGVGTEPIASYLAGKG